MAVCIDVGRAHMVSGVLRTAERCAPIWISKCVCGGCTSCGRSHTSRSPRASRATAWGNGGGGAARRAARGPAHRAAPGPGGRSAARARASPGTRFRRGRYVLDPVGWRGSTGSIPAYSIPFRMRNGATVQSVRRVITLYTFHYLVHTSVERRQELVCHGMAASECSGSTSKGCSIWTPISS